MKTTGLPNAQLNWRASINRYYKGGLDEFGDAQTIRIQIREGETYLAQMAKLEEGIDDGPSMDDWNATFGEEKRQVAELIVELDAWLTKRNLSR